MKEQIKKVQEFHSTFGIQNNEKFDLISPLDAKLRYELMREENEEYIDACNKNDKVAILDSLTDQLYVLLGTIIKHGAQNIIQDAFDLVHENNMSKLDENGKVIRDENGKVKKPSNFKPVDLSNIVNND